jgi:hypothetical protein
VETLVWVVISWLRKRRKREKPWGKKAMAAMSRARDPMRLQ